SQGEEGRFAPARGLDQSCERSGERREGQRRAERVGGEVRGKREDRQQRHEARAAELLSPRQPEPSGQKEDGNDGEGGDDRMEELYEPERRLDPSSKPKRRRHDRLEQSREMCSLSTDRERSVEEGTGKRGVEVLVGEVP